MPIYDCPNCKKKFNRKSNYIYHIENKKRPCNIIILNNINKYTNTLPEYAETLPEQHTKIFGKTLTKK